ncbi:hypothetical protein [Aquiluna sp. KACHI24]|uniref:hypothetical protein n=1 Tax=Aquiluna sp. KACHI24 TaxID=2968831 RepID=UPI0021FD9D9F|nr:hypothetical protein [Aquiluna sp. KACHI24]BDQ00354.1 glutamine amidotransferase [Aquiluna sp. KACHI24]
MISLSSYRPELFNRNADQGNLLVLTKQLQWRGVDFEVLHEFDLSADFVLIGDSFNAVRREYSAELLELAPGLQSRLDQGKATLLVGSSYEFYMDILDGLPNPVRAARVSEFRVAKSGSLSAFGYRNTDLDGSDLFIQGAFIGTALYGPVLAKSPDLLKLVLDAIGVETELSSSFSGRLENYLEQIIKTSIAD